MLPFAQSGYAALIRNLVLFILTVLLFCKDEEFSTETSGTVIAFKGLQSLSALGANFLSKFTGSITSSLLASLVLLSIGLSAYFFSKQVNEKRTKSWIEREKSVALIGKSLPSFISSDLNGVKIKSEELSAKVLLLFFISNIHCSPCIDAADIVQLLYDEFKQKGLSVICISHSPHTSEVKRFSKRFGLQYPIIMDPNFEFRNGLGLPLSLTGLILVNTQGFIAGAWTSSPTEPSEAEALKEQIVDLLYVFNERRSTTMIYKVQESEIERR